MFPHVSNDNCEVTEPKTENVNNDKHDKGKSILGVPPKVSKKKLSEIIIASPIRSLNQRSLISAITVEYLGTFFYIAISG